MSKASEIAASMYGIGEELEKEANELEGQLTAEPKETKPFRMSDYIKPQTINEEVEIVEETVESEVIEDTQKEVVNEVVTEEPKVDSDAEKQASIIDAIEKDVIVKTVNDKQRDKINKIANELLEEVRLIKVASEKNEKVEKIAFAILEEAGFLK